MVMISDDLLSAANDLGSTLNASPVVQEFLQARESFMKDAALLQLKAKIEQVQADLMARYPNRVQRMILPASVFAEFDHLWNTYLSHPLVVEHERCQKAVIALFADVSSTLSSVLSVEYTQLCHSPEEE